MIYSFAFNEDHWRVISLYKHRTKEAAWRAILKRYPYKGTSSSDYDHQVCTVEELVDWANQSEYWIDFEQMIMTSKEADK